MSVRPARRSPLSADRATTDAGDSNCLRLYQRASPTRGGSHRGRVGVESRRRPPKRRTAERVALAVREQTRWLWVAHRAIVLVLGGTATAIFIRSSHEAASAESGDREAARRQRGDHQELPGATAAGRHGAGEPHAPHQRQPRAARCEQATSAAQMAAAEAALRQQPRSAAQIAEMDFPAISRRTMRRSC